MKYLNLIIVLSLILTSCNPTKMENGLIIKESPYNIETTYAKLKTIVDANPSLKILLELDHSKNAASAGLELKPTKIMMFGNPKLGTPLMQASQTIGIDLPQKVIVYASNATTTAKIAYNDPLYLKNRHHIGDEVSEILKKVSGALNTITDKVIAN